MSLNKLAYRKHKAKKYNNTTGTNKITFIHLKEPIPYKTQIDTIP